MLGNLVRSTTMLARLAKDPDWNPTVFGSIVRDKVTGELQPLWPGQWTIPKLLADYRAYRRAGTGHVWVHEMMNLSADTLYEINMDKAVRLTTPTPNKVTAGCIVLDPAFGEDAHHDESAITVHVHLQGSGIPHIVDSRRGRFSEDSLLDQMLELSYYWNLGTWCIESIAAQRLLISVFRSALKLRQIDPEQFLMIGVGTNQQSKPDRIRAMQNAVANQSYGISEDQEELFIALEDYEPSSKAAHDDLPDSAALGLLAWGRHGDVIKERGVQKIALTLLQHDTGGAMNVNEADMIPY